MLKHRFKYQIVSCTFEIRKPHFKMINEGKGTQPQAAPAAVNGSQTQQPNRPSPVKKVTIVSAKSEELIASTPSERNWRGILIALLVIVAVLGMIVFSIVLVSPVEEGPRVKGRRPTLAETLTLEKLATRPFNGTWISETELVYRDPHGGVSVLNAENLTARVLMTNSTFRQLHAVDFKVSGDLKYVLLVSDVRKVFRHSTLARYHVYEVATRANFALSPKEDDPNAPLLQHVAWSPDGKAVAFVHENDLYYKPRVRKALVCRITSSAGANNHRQGAPVILNGVPDWLYEHEILGAQSHGGAFWFSPDSQYLVFLHTNDTQVGTYKYPWYGGFTSNEYHDLKYPEIREIKYPKVGTPNPNVTIWVVNLNRPKYLFPQLVRPPARHLPAGSAAAHDAFNYVTSVKWFADRHLAVVWLNRAQNQSLVALCRAPQFNCSAVHTERPENGAWVHTAGEWRGPVYNQHGDSLHLLPVRDGEHGNYLHLCHVDAVHNRVTPLTHGRFEVVDVLGWDEENHIIYAVATPELRPSERHLYRIGDTNSSLPWQCLTCPEENVFSTENLNIMLSLNTSTDGQFDNNYVLNNETRCQYNRIHFSPDFRFYVQECLGPAPPVVNLLETSCGLKLAVLDPGSALRAKLKQLAKPQIRTFEVEIEDGYRAQVKLFLPPGLRENEDLTFPLVLLIDAEPGTQAVSEKWSSGWAWYLSANRSFIVAQVDGRGSGYQGERMRTEIHHRLGSVDVQDQLAVLSYLRSTFPCVSATRVCVTGTTGYGSYAALTLLATDQNKIVNCTIALSPITSWRLHNTYFTERYLGTSASDYLHADLVTQQRAQSLVSRRLLLAHGTADTEVHAQHAMSLAAVLVKHGALFTHLTYPDTGHDFDDVKMHLYKQIDSFLDDTFDTLDDDFDRWDQPTGSDSPADFFISFRQ